ncbi:dynein light chain Tctex-type 5-B-like [Mya arenaria]|uniref:dynein light chain Tctex-type 5-B-like n=1 Tax=Mya arenaria TaxID=6604 RepID=UPI0022E49D44|nr:dynein light chain Tctex-type 5-B-like [Mya arenaria]
MLLNRMRQASISQESTTSAGRQSTTVTSPRESVKLSATTQAPTQTTKPMLGQTGRGPSILGLLAAKRFTRNMKSKYGRTGSIYGSSRYSTQINIQKEPSYRMEPTKKFNADEAFNALKSVVDKRMEGFRYHPKFCSNMTKMLSDEIKDEVKKLKFDRYKIVAVVHISEKRGQSMMVASRCAWDKNVDEFATYTMETPTLFCSASVFGIYNE